MRSLSDSGKEQTLSAEKLLVATGRRPNTQEIGLEQAGVELGQEGAVRVDCMLRTNVSHIWAADDVIGRETKQWRDATPGTKQEERL